MIKWYHSIFFLLLEFTHLFTYCPFQAGIAFSSRSGAQNIGYIIPVPVVMRFLNEFEKCAQCIIIEEGIMVGILSNNHVALEDLCSLVLC